MDAGRVWRTVRHLTAEQWAFRLIRRGKRGVMRALPGAMRARIAAAARRLPVPDPAAPALLAAARHVARLQEAVHGAHLDGIAAGRFVLLNREYDFGDLKAVAWRGAFDEGNNPLRRMTLAYMGYAVPLLGRGTAEGLDVVLDLLRSLEARNPWSAAGVFRDVWSPYAASHRLINLLAGLALRRAAGARAEAAEAEILDHARFCAAFVRANLERELQYNHLMKNLVALALYRAGLAQAPAALAVLDRALPPSLDQNILGDGGHAERSPMYHALALIDVATLADCGVFSGALAARLAELRARMQAALRVMSHPDGEIALFNDAWLGEAPPAASLTGSASAPACAPLRETGYVRIGEGGDAVVFDCGPCGPDDNPGHAHADFLSIEASVGGRRLVVDPGVPTYSAGALRDLSRSAASHNGPHLAGAEPIEFWKSFRVGRRGTAGAITDETLAGLAPLWCAGWQDGYARLGTRVLRYVGLWPGAAMLVCDLWLGPVRAAAASRFLIPATWSRGDGAALAFTCAGQRVALTAPIGRIAEVGAGRHWPRFGVERPAHLVALVPEQAGASRRAALHFAWAEGAPGPEAGALDGLFARLADCYNPAGGRP